MNSGNINRYAAALRGRKNHSTKPELALRRALTAEGLRYRLRAGARLPGKPDLVFLKAKVAVFVDGCFWHACPVHFRPPKNNAAWWAEKMSRNRSRDAQVDAMLSGQGWLAIRVWEHEDPCEAARRIQRVLQARPLAKAPASASKGWQLDSAS